MLHSSNAGIARIEPRPEEVTDDQWGLILDVNLNGVWRCFRAAIPHMRAQRLGKIVNVASHQAFRPGFGIANYASSKAALIGLTKAAAVEKKSWWWN